MHYDQLLITCEDKVLESINTSKKLKGIFKDDVLILIINADGQEVRKIKFQIRENLLQCLQELKARFPVVSYGSVASKCKITTKYNDVKDVFKSVLEDKVKLNELPIPENYSSFMKLCLLDPAFPQLVQQAKQILDTKVLNKESLM
ncbi:uncharacterized protein LOC123877042 isoform X2 [Maniola jurtina]|nr:uncharacterized protein LOC123877042 isoform X2 [Maniola jurtina]